MENTAVEVYEDLNQALTFGKYRGQPVSVLAGDKSYCDWLVNQDWFRQKYQNVYNVIINNFSKPEDTPEHNSLQAMFLDEDFVKKFAFKYLLRGQCLRDSISIKDNLEYSLKAEFEVKGWDVYYEVRSVFHRNTSAEYSTCACECYIEIKPEIGDDFPTVMRQMKTNSTYSGYDSYSRRNVQYTIPARMCYLIYDRYTGIGVSEEQMRKMFEVNGFHVCRFDELEAVDLNDCGHLNQMFCPDLSA